MIPVFLLALSLANDWGSSPQAYFMTKAERVQWSAMKTELEADTFIKQFVTSRGPGFADEVAKRAAMADKYLTVGKTPGSKSLRGKVIILLGPPSAMTVSLRHVEGERSATTGGYMNAGASSGPDVSDMAGSAQRSAMSAKEVKDYTFTFAGSKLPVPQATDFVITVEADAGTGVDRVTDRGKAAELDAVLEAAAAASAKVIKP